MIDAARLTEVLKQAGHDVEVSDVTSTTIGEGVGMMSGLSRLDVTYARGSGPGVLIAKSPAPVAANLAVAQAFDLYRREVLFYRDLAHRTTARTPHIYFADMDPDGVGFLLLMEDLSHLRLGDQVQGCDLDDSLAGVDWLGRQHAAFWGHVDDPAIAFLPPLYPSYHSEALIQGFGLGWDPMVKAFDAVVPEHHRAMKDLYLAAQPALFQWMASGALTVVHGDFRMDNLFFDPHDGSLIALDWQGALRGRGSQDLAYFLAGSVRTEVRRAHERDLVARWHQRLVEGGVTGFTLDDAFDDYRRAVAYSWTIAVVIAGTLDSSNARAHQWMSLMLDRTVKAMDDLDIEALLRELAGS